MGVSTDFDPALAVATLKKHATELGADSDAYVAAVESRIGGSRTPEDHREATKLATEAAKMILTVDVAGLVAVAALIQFARNNGLAWDSSSIIFFAAAGILGALAAGAGFTAISRVYQRADGRTHPNDPAWSTLTAKGPLNMQAFCSGAALIALTTGFFLWPAASAAVTSAPARQSCSIQTRADQQQRTQVSATLADGSAIVIRNSGGSLTVICKKG